MSELDFLNPDIVRLATYLSTGKTWKGEDGKLKTEVNGKFIPIVRPLFLRYFSPTKCSVGGKVVEIKPEKDGKPAVGRYKHHFTVKDSELLQEFEKNGYLLGSNRRKPHADVVNSSYLFPYYLRVLWECYGKILEVNPLQVALEQKHPQELAELKNLLMMVNIYCEMKRSNFYLLVMSDPDSIKNFFDLFSWDADWKYGARRIRKIKEVLKIE